MKKRIDVKQLTYISIMTSLNVIFVLLNLITPFFGLVLLIALPFAAALVKINTNYKYLLIYLVSTLLITSLIDFQNSLFYVLPGLLSGILFGILIDFKMHGFYMVLITSLFSIITQTISFYLINLIYNIDMFNAFATLLGLDLVNFKNIYLAFFFTIGMIQMLISYFVIEGELSKFHRTINEESSLLIPSMIASICTASLGWILYYYYLPLAYLSTCISLIFSTYLVMYIIKSNQKFIYIISVLLIIISIFVCLFFGNSYLSDKYHLIFNIISLTIDIDSIILLLYLLLIKKTKINEIICDTITKETNNK